MALETARTGKSGGKKHRNSHAREVAMQALYQIEVAEQPLAKVLLLEWLNQPLEASVRDYCQELIRGVTSSTPALNTVIESLSSKDPTQISTVVRNILRMGIFELMTENLDPSIVMDDLINLTRKYDGEESVPFVNGILDRFEKEKRTYRGETK